MRAPTFLPEDVDQKTFIFENFILFSAEFTDNHFSLFFNINFRFFQLILKTADSLFPLWLLLVIVLISSSFTINGLIFYSILNKSQESGTS